MAMIELTSNPWETLSKACRRRNVRQVDVLTGYIGGGATSALRELGVRARILIGLADARAWLSTTQITELSSLLHAGHEVRWLPGLHAKSYVLDGKVVMVGSANFTRPGFAQLDEMLIVTDEAAVAKNAVAEFRSRWNRATVVDPSKLRALRASEEARMSNGGLGFARSALPTGFDAPLRVGSVRDGRSTGGPERIRLMAYWPKWIEELESDSIEWSTSPKAKSGDIHLFAITKTGDGLAEYDGDPRVDAATSLWKQTSRVKMKRSSRWPIHADFEKLLQFEHPVPKSDFRAAGLVARNWPQNPKSGQYFRGDSLSAVAKLLSARNPTQADDIRRHLLG